MTTHSFEPIIQRSAGSSSKVAFKATLTAQSRQITGARARNDEPDRGDPAIGDGFRTLKHESALDLSTQSKRHLLVRGSPYAGTQIVQLKSFRLRYRLMIGRHGTGRSIGTRR